MFPTLHENDRVLVNKLSYDLHDVNRGDLVVFERPPGETDTDIKDLIKRVVGLPGDVVSSCGGQVCIDGTPLEEPYLPDGATTGEFERQTVPDDHVFVMGDNRDNSRDSRIFGPIEEDSIVGRAFVRIWPITDFGLL
jgi:signal peptidase I